MAFVPVDINAIKLDGAPQPKALPSRGRTALEQGLQGATFNLADEASDAYGAGIAYLSDKIRGIDGGSYSDIYDYARKDTQKRLAQQLEDRPALSIGANIGGALLTGGAGAATKGGTALANSLRTGGLGLRTAKASVLGAATGSASGFGAGSGRENRLESAGDSAVDGGLVGGAIPVVGAVANSVIKGTKNAGMGMAARGRDELVESGKELKDVVSAAYKKVDDAGAVINPEAANELLSGIKSNLAQIELIPELNPKTLGVVRYIEEAASKAPLKVTQIDQYRRLLSGIRDEDSIAASAARKGIDDFLLTLDETKLSGGDANVGKYLLSARAAASQDFRFSKVAEILTRADGDPNKIKSGLTTLLNKKGATAGWSPDEVAALREAASSSTPEKLLKMGGKFGIDLGTSLTAGNTVAPLVGALAGGIGGGVGTAGIVPVAGTAARYGQKLAARGKAEKLLQAIEGIPQAKGGLPAVISSPQAGKLAAPAGMITGSQSPTRIEVNPNQENPYAQELPQVDLPQGFAPVDINAIKLDAPTTTVIEPLSYNTEIPASGYLQKLAQVESGGNPNAKAKTSSASGLYQFTNGTWKAMVDKYGAQYGIGVGDKMNPQAQQIMAELHTQENAQELSKVLGREPNAGELYAAHFLGIGGAKKLLGAVGTGRQAALLFPAAAQANKNIFFANGQPRTVEQVYQLLAQKMSA